MGLLVEIYRQPLFWRRDDIECGCETTNNDCPSLDCNSRFLIVALPEPSPKVETITGQVVAYSAGLETFACTNGNTYWSMLIHVLNRTDSPATFIQVRFSLPCKEAPQWLNQKSPVQKFRLKRERDADSVLKEFVECAPDSGEKCHLLTWKLVPGAENEKLPFDHIVPSYQSVDLPLAPVV